MSKGEFERISDYFAPLAANFGGAYGLTDDAATIAPGTGRTLVVTTDTIVERVHFIGDETADLIARKLLRVSPTRTVLRLVLLLTSSTFTEQLLPQLQIASI